MYTNLRKVSPGLYKGNAMKNPRGQKFLIVALSIAAFACVAGAAGPGSRTATDPHEAKAFQSDPGSAADRESLRKAEEYWLQHEDDPDALETILGDDFVHVFSSGFVSKAEHIAYIRSLEKPATPPKKYFDDLRVRVYGDTGIANGVVVHEASDGNVRKTVFTDVFVRRRGKWEAVNAQELP
jgi:hypothetical protein